MRQTADRMFLHQLTLSSVALMCLILKQTSVFRSSTASWVNSSGTGHKTIALQAVVKKKCQITVETIAGGYTRNKERTKFIPLYASDVALHQSPAPE